MTKAYQEVNAFIEAKPGTELQVQSNERFFSTFSAENPYTEEDGSLHQKAEDLLNATPPWEGGGTAKTSSRK